MSRAAWLCLLLCAPALGWDSARLSQSIVIDGRNIPYPEFAIYVMPGQRIDVRAGREGRPAAIHYGGAVTNAERSVLTAPAEPGQSRLEITWPDSPEHAVVQVFTMFAATRVDRDGRLNGYRIGRYPAQPLHGIAIYRPPQGFVEVTAANADTRLSPNFRLAQFVCKQEHGYPRYVVLRPDLLLKLESILAALNRRGHATDSLVVMSGYRTPFYNRAIGNVPNSRHLWGGAADVYIDEAPADGRMDDLNGDGRIDVGDARWLAAFVNTMTERGEFGPRIGGLGIYGSTESHGPFIHVDVRGARARW